MNIINNVREDMICLIDTIGDLSYAWEIIHDFIPPIESKVKQEPSTILMLRPLLHKISSSVNHPMFSTTKSLNQYTFQKFVHFMEDCLQIILNCIFDIFVNVMDVLEDQIKLLPSKIEIDSLPEYAQSDQRCKLAKLTYEASIFQEAMKSLQKFETKFSCQVNIKENLEISIRKELVKQMSSALHQSLQFQTPSRDDPSALLSFRETVLSRFTSLDRKVCSMKMAMTVLQNYVGFPGLKLFLKENYRVIFFNKELEANRYLQRPLSEQDSKYQSASIPIPQYPRIGSDSVSVNFIGRTMVALLRLTDPQKTIYSLNFCGWFLPTGREVCGVRIFSHLYKSIGIHGLTALDELFKIRVAYELQRFFQFYNNTVKTSSLIILEQIRDELFPEWKTPAEASRIFASARRKVEKLIMPVVYCLGRVGQAQLLRKMIKMELNVRIPMI